MNPLERVLQGTRDRDPAVGPGEGVERQMDRVTCRLRIGEILSREGKITEAQITEGLREQLVSGERLGRCLLRLGHVSEDAFLSSLGEQLALERVSLARLKVPAEAA